MPSNAVECAPNRDKEEGIPGFESKGGAEVRVENDEMYGDWAHWLQAPCPVCAAPLRAHHLHDFASLICRGCRQNPLLHFCGITAAKRHGPAMTKLLLDEGLLPEVAADIAAELKADATLPQVVEFLLSMHYVKPEALENLLKERAAAGWVAGMTMTFTPEVVVASAPSAPRHGDRVDLREWEIGPELAKRIPRTIAKVYRCVPVWADGAHVVLAVDNPEKVRVADLAGLMGCEVALVKATKEQIAEVLKKHYGAAGWQEAWW
ncbi:MAG: hypothetical protein FD180_2778 [Planctomycetota bacterium]|nr:MAG: hypothetical protein FD180_2778 [Planctomycetota bacterium]